ncbi:MAG: SDR family oxidoreductase [Acidimicrobiia bacterium]
MPTGIVTGGSRGLGSSIAAALADRGWDLVIDGRTAEDLRVSAMAMERSCPGRIFAITGDVTDLHHVSQLVEEANRIGDLRLLVNNASTLGPSPMPALDVYPADALRHVLEVNLIAPLRLIQDALPALRSSHGTIVNITSDAAVEGYEGWGGYGSSKAALEQLSNVLAAEEPDVRVYWFDPGDMQTRMHQDAFPGEDISDRPLPETRVPALLDLLDSAPPSGRYTADLLLEPSL